MKWNRPVAGLAVLFSITYAVLVATPFAVAADEVREPAKKAAKIKKETKKEVGLVGSSQSKTYHVSGCRMAKKIKPENLVKFTDESEAEKDGYSPCKICIKA